jgi:hypothetical protein
MDPEESERLKRIEEMLTEMYEQFKDFAPIMKRATRNGINQKVAANKIKGWVNNG